MPVAGAVIGGISSIAGGLIGANSAKGAANTLQNAALTAAGNVNTAAGDAETWISKATQDAQGGVTGAVSSGQQGVNTATGQANQTLADIYKSLAGTYSPYLQLGSTGAQTLSQAVAPGGSLTQQFSFDPTQIANNPDYQFQLQQGLQSVLRSQAATGQIQGGGTLKALTQYSQGLASNEIAQAYNQALTTFQTNRQNTLGNISALLSGGQFGAAGLAQAGQNYGNQAAANTLGAATYGSNLGFQGAQYSGNTGFNAAQYAGNTAMQQNQLTGNYLLQAALARAGGQVSSTNNLLGALNGGLLNLNTAGTNLYGWNQSQGSPGGGTIGGLNQLPYFTSGTYGTNPLAATTPQFIPLSAAASPYATI